VLFEKAPIDLRKVPTDFMRKAVLGHNRHVTNGGFVAVNQVTSSESTCFRQLPLTSPFSQWSQC
jgi:hypothetical protein